MRAVKLTALLFLFFVVSAGSAWAEVCQYNTEWGVLTIDYNYDNNTVSGHYPHHNGAIRGRLTDDGVIRGTWTQNNGNGGFYFRLNDSGFSGNWNYSGDSNWRGTWNGSLIQCYH
jgi:hypothetical protein